MTGLFDPNIIIKKEIICFRLTINLITLVEKKRRDEKVEEEELYDYDADNKLEKFQVRG